MEAKSRPTSVTVIAWAWIVIGGLMVLSAAFGLLAYAVMPANALQGKDIPAIFRFFPLLALLQIVFAALGITAGINLLKLCAWARTVLEIQSWLLLGLTLGYMVFWVDNWLSMTSGQTPAGFAILGAVMGAVITFIYAIPLAIMLWFLRGRTVRDAVAVRPGD